MQCGKSFGKADWGDAREYTVNRVRGAYFAYEGTGFAVSFSRDLARCVGRCTSLFTKLSYAIIFSVGYDILIVLALFHCIFMDLVQALNRGDCGRCLFLCGRKHDFDIAPTFIVIMVNFECMNPLITKEACPYRCRKCTYLQYSRHWISVKSPSRSSAHYPP